MENYEFNKEENEIFSDLARNLVFASFLFVLIGLISFYNAFNGGEISILFLVFGISMIVLGITFFIPNDNFRNIVETKGNDIGELIDGLSEINSGWSFVLLILLVHRINIVINYFIA